MAQPGLHQLYLPHLLCQVHGHGRLPTPMPHDLSNFNKPAGAQASTIPFAPTGDQKLPNETTLHPLIRVLSSTSDKSATKTPEMVANLGQDKRLVTLKKCDDLAERFRLYADPQSRGVQAKTEAGHAFLEDLFGRRSTRQQQVVLHTDGPQSLEYPDQQQQYEVILRLMNWFQLHASDNSLRLVSSEPAIQDEVALQLLRPLGLLLQVCR